MENSSFDFYSLFGLVALGQGLFLLIFLVLKKWQHLSYRLLGFTLFVLLFEVIHDFCVRTRLILEIPHLLSTAHFFSYAIGPLILLYVLSLTKKDFKLRYAHLLHFVPLILYNISKFPSYWQSTSQKLGFLSYYYQSLDNDPLHFFETRGIENILEGFLRYDVHKLVYVIVALYYFLQYQRQIRNEYSTLERTNIQWMKVVLFGYSIIWLLIPIQRFSGFFITNVELVNNIGFTLLPLHIYFISFIVFSQKPNTELPIQTTTNEIDKTKLNEILVQCDAYLKTSQRFLVPDLTLTSLSKELEIRAHSLSSAVNQLKGINFLDYVNHYRVEEAVRLLGQPDQQQYTVEHIGTLAGFTSKTTFYRAFKKQLGTTPSQFQKQLFNSHPKGK